MKWHFYDPSTGLFVGSFSGNEYDVEANTPVGVGVLATAEHIDHTAQRVDLGTCELIAYVAPPASAEVLAQRLRAARDGRLAACDWVVARAVETSAQVPEAWRAYRAALRDLPSQTGFPTEIQWPEAPPG